MSLHGTLPPKSLPVIALVGRPNVGKSSLFNRILRRRVAIVHEESGTTRDRITAVAEHDGQRFVVMDTGGLCLIDEEKSHDIFASMIAEQLDVAIASADVIIFVMDASTGVQPLDTAVAKRLRASGKKVVVAANKADNPELIDGSGELFRLGFDPIIPTSCAHNHNIDELLTAALSCLPFQRSESEAPETSYIDLAVIGRPNVGKSSLINYLLDEERLIVTDIPGTTRDTVDSRVSIRLNDHEAHLNLIDTAGIRRKRNFRSAVDYFSLDRAVAAMKRAEIVWIVLDAVDGITAVDKQICRMVADEYKPCVITANKWDQAGKQRKQKELIETIRESLPFLDFSPIFTCCAVSGYNVSRVLTAVQDLVERQDTNVPTPVLNRVVQDLMLRQPPPTMGGTRSLKIYYSVAAGSKPITFRLFVNRKQLCPPNYRAYLERQLRKTFDLDGLPIRIELQERRGPAPRGT